MANADLARSQATRVARKRQQRAERRTPMGAGALAPKAVEPKREAKPVSLFRSAPTTTSFVSDSRKKAQAARAKLPSRPVPNIPVINAPTRGQQRAAGELIRKQERTATQGKSGAAYNKAVAANQRELASDPRSAQFLKARDYYLGVSSRSVSGSAGRNIARQQGRRVTLAQSRRLGAQAQAANPRASNIRPGTHAGGRTIRIGPASIPVTAAANLATHALALDRGPGIAVRKFIARNAKGDAGQTALGITLGPEILGVQALAGVSDLAGIGSAKAGDTQRLRKLATGLYEGSRHSTPGELLTGHPGKALEALEKAPLGNTFAIAGALNAAGRGAGAGVRLGGAAGVKPLARAGSTVRPPLATDVDGLAPLIERTYSKDLFRKAAQARSDSKREKLTRQDGTVVTASQRGRDVPVLRATRRESERDQRKAANYEAGRSVAMQQMARVKNPATHVVSRKATGVRGRRAQDAKDLVAMVHEGTILTGGSMARDLTRYRDRLASRIADGGGYRTNKELKDAKDTVAFVDRALASPKVLAQAEHIAQAGIERGRLSKGNDDDLIAAGAGLTKEQAKRRRLLAAAITHLDARHVTKEEHGRLERAAGERENALRERLKAAPVEERAGLRAQVAAAREERIAVSGRDPRKVERFEAAREQAGLASRRVLAAKDQLARVRAARATAAPDRVGELERRETAVREKLEAAKGERRAAKAIVDRGMPKAQAALRRPDGRRLSTEDIENHLRAEGRDPETVGYLPHKQMRPGEGFFARADVQRGRGNLSKEASTGEAYARGSAPRASEDLLRQAGARQATQIEHARSIDKSINDYGQKHPAWAKHQRGETLTPKERKIVEKGHGYFTAKEAQEYADRVRADTEGDVRLVPVRAFSSRLDAESKRIIAGDLQGPGAGESLAQRLLNGRFLTEADMKSKARTSVVMPEDFLHQMDAHMKPAGSIQRAFQTVNAPFRKAVLATPRWLAGNAVEPYLIRLPVEGSGAINVFGLGADIAVTTTLIRRARRSGDPSIRAAADEVQAKMLGGQQSSRSTIVHRPFTEGLPPRAQRAYARLIARVPGVVKAVEAGRWVGRFLQKPNNAIFQVNRWIEGGSQRAALGRLLRRDMREITGNWLGTIKLGDRAYEELSKGLTNTSTQRRYQEGLHRILGQYDSFGPTMRVLTQTALPFLPWVLNASRFVFWTMPVHHTATSATLALASDVLSKDFQNEHKDAPPGSLRYALLKGDGGLIDVARYTPYGLPAELSEGTADPYVGNFLPQARGALNALQGKDPFGRDLKMRPTPGDPQGKSSLLENIGIAVNQVAESSVPYLSQARRLREGGSSGYGNSNIFSPKPKPGTDTGSPFERVYNPLHATYLHGKPSRGTATASRGDDARAIRQSVVADRGGALSSDQLRAIRGAAIGRTGPLSADDLRKIRGG